MNKSSAENTIFSFTTSKPKRIKALISWIFRKFIANITAFERHPNQLATCLIWSKPTRLMQTLFVQMTREDCARKYKVVDGKLYY